MGTKLPIEYAYEQCMMANEHALLVKDKARQAFAVELRGIREKLKMTSREFGKAIGVTGSHINQIENLHRCILKKDQLNRVIELCTSSLQSKRGNTASRSVATQQAMSDQCTNEESHSQEVSNQSTKNWSWPPSDFKN